MLTTSIQKALFYCDLKCLLETGRTATRTTYVALKAGPVVENYHEQLIRPLETLRST